MLWARQNRQLIVHRDAEQGSCPSHLTWPAGKAFLRLWPLQPRHPWSRQDTLWWRQCVCRSKKGKVVAPPALTCEGGQKASYWLLSDSWAGYDLREEDCSLGLGISSGAGVLSGLPVPSPQVSQKPRHALQAAEEVLLMRHVANIGRWPRPRRSLSSQSRVTSKQWRWSHHDRHPTRGSARHSTKGGGSWTPFSVWVLRKALRGTPRDEIKQVRHSRGCWGIDSIHGNRCISSGQILCSLKKKKLCHRRLVISYMWQGAFCRPERNMQIPGGEYEIAVEESDTRAVQRRATIDIPARNTPLLALLKLDDWLLSGCHILFGENGILWPLVLCWAIIWLWVLSKGF